MNSLPPDVQAALDGLGVVTFDGTIKADAKLAVYFFTIRDPAFPDCEPTFAVKASALTPGSLLAAYARTMRAFAKEFTRPLQTQTEQS